MKLGSTQPILRPAPEFATRPPIGACQRAGLDLPAVRRHRQIGDGRVLGLARPVRHHRRVTGALRHLDRGQRLGQRADLIDLDQDRVRDALADALRQACDIGDEQIVADKLAAPADEVGQNRPAGPVVLGHAVLDGNDRVFGHELGEVLGLLLAVAGLYERNIPSSARYSDRGLIGSAWVSLGVVLGPGRHASRFARQRGPSDAPLFGHFGSPVLQPLCKRRKLLLSRSDLRRGLLPPLRKGFEFASGRGQCGLDLGQVPGRQLLLASLSQELILGSL